MPRLVVISKPDAGLSYELGKHWVTIGRAPGNAFQIVQSSVSGQHCEVLLRENELLVRDMRSTNGTFIHGRLISESVLRMGETLQLGEVELRLEASDPKVIPLSLQERDQQQNGEWPAASYQARNGNHGLEKRQVLLVDDSMAFLETTAEVFEAFADGEWEVHQACGADEALGTIQKRRIDLAVLDINMPMLDGMQLLGMLHRRHPEVKKIMLTGVANETYRTNCLAAGAELFLEKPITRDGMRFVFNVINDLMTWTQREGFAGTLQQVGLSDVIQIECLRRNSCVLEVHTPHAKGEIYIETGAIIHAVAGEVTGEKALQRLLALNNGQFHLYPYRQPSERTVRDAWEYLLIEAARLRDEERHAQSGEKTTFLARPGTQPRANGKMGSTPQKTGEPKCTTTVSTYDGKWKTVEREKPESEDSKED